MLSYILPFIVLILVVVFIHEYGHYYFAKKYGVGVTDFSIDDSSLVDTCDMHNVPRQWKIKVGTYYSTGDFIWDFILQLRHEGSDLP